MTADGRLRRDTRAEEPPRMRLMPRDLEILQAVGEYRILRQDQLQALFFGSKSTAQYRLSHLYQHGYLARHFLPVVVGRSPTLYTLDAQGAQIVRTHAGEPVRLMRWNAESRGEFLAHTLAINDVRVVFTLACRVAGYTVPIWRHDAELKTDYDRVRVAGRAVSLIPDSYFVLQTKSYQAHFFLELDRGTMTTKRFAEKVVAYNAYVAQGQYQQRYGTRSLRVLTVTTSSLRLNHLKTATEQAHGGKMFWFSTLAALTHQTVLDHPIWQIAGSKESAALVTG